MTRTTDFVGHVMGSEPGSNPHWTSYAGWGAYAPVVARIAESLGVTGGPQLTGWSPRRCTPLSRPGTRCSSGRRSTTRRRPPAPGPLGRENGAVDAGGPRRRAHGRQHVCGDPRVQRSADRPYNGTTMAQFARTFTIYGSMAIVIERVAQAARPHVTVRQGGARSSRTPVVGGHLPATPAPWVPTATSASRAFRRRRRRRTPPQASAC